MNSRIRPLAAQPGLGGDLLQALTIRKLIGVGMPFAQTLASFGAGALLALSALAVRRRLNAVKIVDSPQPARRA